MKCGTVCESGQTKEADDICNEFVYLIAQNQLGDEQLSIFKFYVKKCKFENPV